METIEKHLLNYDWKLRKKGFLCFRGSLGTENLPVSTAMAGTTLWFDWTSVNRVVQAAAENAVAWAMRNGSDEVENFGVFEPRNRRFDGSWWENPVL